MIEINGTYIIMTLLPILFTVLAVKVPKYRTLFIVVAIVLYLGVFKFTVDRSVEADREDNVTFNRH